MNNKQHEQTYSTPGWTPQKEQTYQNDKQVLASLRKAPKQGADVYLCDKDTVIALSRRKRISVTNPPLIEE